MTIQCSTKVCSFGKQVVEKVEVSWNPMQPVSSGITVYYLTFISPVHFSVFIKSNARSWKVPFCWPENEILLMHNRCCCYYLEFCLVTVCKYPFVNAHICQPKPNLRQLSYSVHILDPQKRNLGGKWYGFVQAGCFSSHPTISVWYIQFSAASYGMFVDHFSISVLLLPVTVGLHQIVEKSVTLKNVLTFC